MSSPKIGIFIQARSNSSRFPNKIYQGLPNKNDPSLLEHIYNRLSKIKLKNTIAILIPENDKVLANWCQKKSICYFTGPEFDVRERYRQATKHYNIDILVRATGDNPCVDPKIATESILAIQNSKADLFSFGNLPLGIAIEVMKTSALLKNISNETKEHQEHVSIHIKQKKYLFKVEHPNHPIIKKPNKLRLTVDTQKDFQVVQNIFKNLGHNFSLTDILELHQKSPELFLSNASIQQHYPQALFFQGLRN